MICGYTLDVTSCLASQAAEHPRSRRGVSGLKTHFVVSAVGVAGVA